MEETRVGYTEVLPETKKMNKVDTAIEELKTQSTDDEYENLIREMFNKLDRRGKRKVILKKFKFSATVTKSLNKKK